MISRTTIGRSFAGLVRYQFEGHKGQETDKRAEVLAAVGVRADTPEHMIADFNRGRRLNPELGKAVWHTSLSFNPDDAAKMSSGKMLAVAEDYVQGMGLDKTQYAIIRHHDRPGHEHVHIIANRVADDGHSIKDGQNFYHSKVLLTELIQRHELTPPQGMRAEKQRPEQLHGVDLTKHEIKEALRTVLATATDSKQLREGLQEQAITFKVFQTKEGKPAGISFEKDGQTFKGSEVHRSYSIAAIGKQLVANQAAQQALQAKVLEEQVQQEARRKAHQVADQRQDDERRAAQAPKVPELPAIERKWQAAYQSYSTEIAQQNAQVQAYNKLVDSYSDCLKVHPNAEGAQAVVKAIENAPQMKSLKVELERQVTAIAHHRDNVARTYGQREALEKQARGLLGFGLGEEAKAAREKLAILDDKHHRIPDDKHRMFAIYAADAAKPAPAIGFDSRSYHQPERVGMSLTAYAAQREAEKQLVVRVTEPAHEIQTTGRAEILRNTLTSKGAAVSMSHTVDAQGNRVSEVVVQYSLQQPRSEVKDISFVLDWAAKQKGHELQERDADRAQRQAPGQRDAQQERTQGPRHERRGHGIG